MTNTGLATMNCSGLQSGRWCRCRWRNRQWPTLATMNCSGLQSGRWRWCRCRWCNRQWPILATMMITVNPTTAPHMWPIVTVVITVNPTTYCSGLQSGTRGFHLWRGCPNQTHYRDLYIHIRHENLAKNDQVNDVIVRVVTSRNWVLPYDTCA